MGLAAVMGESDPSKNKNLTGRLRQMAVEMMMGGSEKRTVRAAQPPATDPVDDLY